MLDDDDQIRKHITALLLSDALRRIQLDSTIQKTANLFLVTIPFCKIDVCWMVLELLCICNRIFLILSFYTSFTVDHLSNFPYRMAILQFLKQWNVKYRIADHTLKTEISDDISRLNIIIVWNDGTFFTVIYLMSFTSCLGLILKWQSMKEVKKLI